MVFVARVLQNLATEVAGLSADCSLFGRWLVLEISQHNYAGVEKVHANGLPILSVMCVHTMFLYCDPYKEGSGFGFSCWYNLTIGEVLYTN